MFGGSRPFCQEASHTRHQNPKSAYILPERALSQKAFWCVCLHLSSTGPCLHPYPQTHRNGTGILCPPLDDTYRRSLDDIIIKMSPLTSRAEKLLSDPSPPVLELLELQKDLLAIDDEITYWAYDRPPSWNPEVVGEVWMNPAISEEATFNFAGPVEKYFDSRLKLLPRLCEFEAKFAQQYTLQLHGIHGVQYTSSILITSYILPIHLDNTSLFLYIKNELMNWQWVSRHPFHSIYVTTLRPTSSRQMVELPLFTQIGLWEDFYFFILCMPLLGVP